MGMQGSPRSPRPMSKNYYWNRSSDSLGASDPNSIGRRISGIDNYWNSKVVLLHGLKDDTGKFNPGKAGKRHIWFRRNVKFIAFVLLLMAFLFLLDSLMVSIFDSVSLQSSSTTRNSTRGEV